MKTLVINGKIKAAGNPNSLLRYAKIIIRKDKLKNPNISLLKGIILKLEEAI